MGLQSYVSNAGLSSVLKHIRENGLPDADSRRSIKRARQSRANIETSYGPLIRSHTFALCEPAATLELNYVHPAAALSNAVCSSDTFAEFMFSRLESCPSTQDQHWGIVVYTDEVSPGNQLKGDNKRKVHTCYWSLMQYGHDGLSNECLWFTLCVARSSLVNRMGGLSVFLKHMLLTFFNGPDFRKGLSLRWGERVQMLFASLQIVIADESALKSLWCIKGASGTIGCLYCRNVVMRSSQLDRHDPSGTLVSATCLDVSKFQQHSDNSLFETIDFLVSKRPTMLNTPFGKLEQSVGISLCIDGILMCPELRAIVRPISCTMFDWMHCYLVNGIFNIECGFLLHRLHKAGFTAKRLHDHFQTLIWPLQFSSKACSGSSVFEKRGTNDDVLKCAASESLGIYSPLRQFLVANLADCQDRDLQMACQCFYRLAHVLDLLRNTSCESVTPESLMRAIKQHLEFFKSTYGEDHMTPKFHMVLHLPEQFRRHNMLLSCFTHERKHKSIKRFANHLHNTSKDFESSVIESMTLAHLDDFADSVVFPSSKARLVNPSAAKQELTDTIRQISGLNGDVETSRTAVLPSSTQCSVNDVVACQIEGDIVVGQIWFHASVLGNCFTCISMWQPVAGNQFLVVNNPIIVDTSCVKDTCVWFSTATHANVIPSFRSCNV